MNLIKRQSNLELLRILAMFLIVAHHFAVHGGGKVSFPPSLLTIFGQKSYQWEVK